MTGIEYLEIPGSAGMLRGMIHRGTSDTWVLIVHGYFSSNKIGPYRLYFELAEKLRSKGLTVVRMDLSGMGESDGSIEDIRYYQHLNDFETLRDTVESRYRASALHIVAHCAGCNIALSAPVKASLRGLTLVAPFAPGARNFEGRMFNATEWRELLETGSTLRKGWYCHKSFIDSAAILSCPLSPTLRQMTHAIFACDDEMTPLSDSQAWADSLGIRYSYVPGADHNFISRSSKNALFDMVAGIIFASEGSTAS